MKETQSIPVEKYQDSLSVINKLRRLIWNIVALILFRPFSFPCFRLWRNFVLRLFGAKIGKGSVIRSTSVIWDPRNLVVGDRTCIGPFTRIYNPAPITLGDKVTISQYAYLCTASHDIYVASHPLVTKPIFINSFAWVAADAFIGMGVTIGQGAVVGARAAVFKDVAPWTVVGGNPARFIKERKIHE